MMNAMDALSLRGKAPARRKVTFLQLYELLQGRREALENVSPNLEFPLVVLVPV